MRLTLVLTALCLGTPAVCAQAPSPLVLADSLEDVAARLYIGGDNAGARPLYERALALREGALGPGSFTNVRTLSGYSLVLRAQADYVTARPVLERVLALHEGAFGSDDPRLVRYLSDLARLLKDLGDYAAAQPLYERALALRERELGPDHLYVVRALDDLAHLLRDRGMYAEARPLYERALATREGLGADAAGMAEGMGNLAELLRMQGDPDAAQPLYERSLSLRETAPGTDNLGLARGLHDMGLLLYERRDVVAARPYLERALVLRERHLWADHPDIAQTLRDLAAVLMAQGDTTGARPLLERALAIQERVQGPTHRAVAVTLRDMAVLYLVRGDFAGARLLLERVVTIREGFGADTPALASSRVDLAALLLADQNDVAAARPLLGQAAQTFTRHAATVLPALAPAEQRAFVDGALSSMVGPLLSTADAASLSDTYGLVAGWKGLLLDGLRRQTAVTALAANPAHTADVERLRVLRARVAAAYRVEDPALDSLTEAKEGLERALARALPVGAAEDPWADNGLAALRTSLPPGTALADVFRYALWAPGASVLHYAAVVTTRDAAPTLVDLGRAGRLDTLAAAWRAASTRGRPAVGETAALAAALWGPITAALPPGTASAWVSPDGDLVGVPWAALAEAHSGPAGPLVAQVPSARALLTLLQTAPEPDPTPSLLLVGGVAFGADGAPFPLLPGTDAEVAALTALARAERFDTTVMTGAEPTPAAVAAAMAGSSYVHLATHGFFYGETAAAYASRGVEVGIEVGDGDGGGGRRAVSRNPLAESGLALAGANVPGAPGGGRVTAEELVGLDLSSARLVVLSACETGRGAEVTGQGVLGLQAALAAAGARALLMSLWKVPDASTAALMGAFYRGLWEGGLAPAAALRQAQAAVRTTPGWEAPVHWAAWVVSGDAF